MTAVAESAPTTRRRDEPRMANTAIGSSSVYRPVTTSVPAIFAYPRATEMLTAARVTLASMSAVMPDRCTGSSLRITGGARSRAGRERPRESGTVTSACFPGGYGFGNHPAATPFRALAQAPGSGRPTAFGCPPLALRLPGHRRLTHHRRSTTRPLSTSGCRGGPKGPAAQNTPLCAATTPESRRLRTAQNGGYLKSSLDNAWWAGISAA
jgi:hypothetical protein